MLTIGPLDDLPRVRHAFFTREGGVSEGLFASLNCGLGSGDDQERIAENRARAMTRLGLAPDRLVTAYQIHSADVAVVDRPLDPDERPKVDALVTKQTDLALGVLTADCVPVLFADSAAGVAGAAHAGWRGALDGVLAATVTAMEGLGAERGRIVAGIGPAIAQESYEVGPEFPAPFLEQDGANGNFFRPAARDGHFMFDLTGYVASRLAALGLGAVEALPADTCGDAERFFSYRRSCLRGEPDYGRGLSAIVLES